MRVLTTPCEISQLVSAVHFIMVQSPKLVQICSLFAYLAVELLAAGVAEPPDLAAPV